MLETPETPDTAPAAPLPDAAGPEPIEAAPVPEAQPPRPEPSVAETARQLAARFPALFGAGVVKPIKLRIQADIHQRAPGVFAKKALSIFLQRHTTATAYLRALVAEGAARCDLDGQPAGEVAAEHRDAAGVELERRRAIVEAKKRAGREAARAARQEARPPRPGRGPLPAPTGQPADGSQAAPEAVAGQPKATEGQPVDRGARTMPPRPSDRVQRRRPTPADARRGPRQTAGEGAGEPRRVPQRPVDRPIDRPKARPPGPPAHRPPSRSPARVQEREPEPTPAVALSPEQAAEAEARRQRGLLLRSFEQSPLSKANFGALKGLNEAALDALLELARKERAAR